MIINVFIVRHGMGEFLEIDPETGNWGWTKNLDDASIYQTQEEAEAIKLQRNLGEDAWVYQMPKSVDVVAAQQRKKKIKKSKMVRKSIKKSKKCKCK